MRKIKLQKIVGNLMDKLRKLHKWKGSPRNSQPSSRYRKFQAIFASPNRYFTEKSLWVPLHGPRGVHLSQRVDCNNKLVKKQRRVIYTEYFIYQAFSYNVHYQKKNNEPEETSPRGLSGRKKRQNLKFLSECYPQNKINYTSSEYVWPIPSEIGVRIFL